MFVDADVSVHRDALRLTAEVFETQPDVAAVFGSYDPAPAAPGLLSQYRNLAHRYVHQNQRGDAETFWAGCGAVRTDVFVNAGGFDETLTKASVEDIELGYRLSAQRHRIILRPDIQGRHLKRWTLWNMIVTDVQRRGVPWLRLLLNHKKRPKATLNVRVSEQVCTGLAAIGWLAFIIWLWRGETSWLILVAGITMGVVAMNLPLIAWFGEQRGWRFAVAIIPLRVLYYSLNVVSVGIALASIGVERFIGERRGLKSVERRLQFTRRS
jgi:hypothetical protein